jgi:hypothetical protein
MKFRGAWYDAFGYPERRGVWFIWGKSANGKTSFVMQLCKELAKWGKVAYNSLEEADSLTLCNTIERYGMAALTGNEFIILPAEPMSKLSERLEKKRSPDIVVIDSLQYTQMSYRDYIDFKERHADKLLIFISHADGNHPAGRAARSVMYDASLKIWVEGFRAISKGRYIGPLGYYTIWEEGAAKYWKKETEEEQESEAEEPDEDEPDEDDEELEEDAADDARTVGGEPADDLADDFGEVSDDEFFTPII